MVKKRVKAIIMVIAPMIATVMLGFRVLILVLVLFMVNISVEVWMWVKVLLLSLPLTRLLKKP